MAVDVASLPLIASGYRLRPVRVLISNVAVTLLLPANPSRWQICFCPSVVQTYRVSPFSANVATSSYTISSTTNLQTINFRDSPVLCTSPWFAIISGGAPAVVEVWETVQAGT